MLRKIIKVHFEREREIYQFDLEEGFDLDIHWSERRTTQFDVEEDFDPDSYRDSLTIGLKRCFLIRPHRWWR